jgi:hypothetical protein
MTNKEVKRIIEATVGFDSVTVRKDVVICKRAYFYRHGQSVEKLARAIKYVLPQVEILEEHDYFKQWPADSYMEVRCRFVSNAAH